METKFILGRQAPSNTDFFFETIQIQQCVFTRCVLMLKDRRLRTRVLITFCLKPITFCLKAITFCLKAKQQFWFL